MSLVFLSLGSNLGDRLENLKSAVEKLRSRLSLVSCSSVWETAPVDCPAGSSAFLNAVCSFECGMEPLELLRFAKEIEKALGRKEKTVLNEPRPMDVDILSFGNVELSSEELTIPHPRMEERLFVLAPLREIQKKDFLFTEEYTSLSEKQKVSLFAPPFAITTVL